MEMGKDGEEDILRALHKAMQMEFGHAMAEKMIDEIRNLVHKQTAGGGQGRKERTRREAAAMEARRRNLGINGTRDGQSGRRRPRGRGYEERD